MTDLLLLIIIGLISNASNWYWVLIGVISVFEFLNAIIKLGTVNKE